VADVNGNTEKGAENELKKLSDDLYKAGRQRLRTLILAIVSLTVSALSSFSPSHALNALTQLTSLALLIYAFGHGLGADTSLISIFHDAVLLNLKRDVTVKALGSSDEQTSTPSRQPGRALSNRLAKLTRDPYSIVRIVLASYIIEFIGLFNIAFNLITRVSGLSIQLQPLLSTFSMIVPISASILLGLSQWSVSTAVRGSLESSCTPVWLEMLKEVRVLLFVTFMSILFIYVYSISLMPMSLTPSTRAIDILADSLYFGLGLGLLASLAFLLMLLTLLRDVIHLECSQEQAQGK
jgi:magnesium-transporting ATPase (P-type)